MFTPRVASWERAGVAPERRNVLPCFAGARFIVVECISETEQGFRIWVDTRYHVFYLLLFSVPTRDLNFGVDREWTFERRRTLLAEYSNCCKPSGGIANC